MGKGLHSFQDLKRVFEENNLSKAVELSKSGQHAQAIKLFDEIKAPASLEREFKLCFKNTYYIQSKSLAVNGKISEAIRCVDRAREIDPADSILQDKRKLLVEHNSYATINNIIDFRMGFSLGCSSGGFEKYPYPFLEIARHNNVLEVPAKMPHSAFIQEIHTIGTYKIASQGWHLLSKKIREYKKENNFSLKSPLAWLISDYLRNRTTFLASIDFIVPSPSNPCKHITRSFIPALLVGQELSKCLNIPYRELFFIKPMDRRFRELSYEEGKELVQYKEIKTQKTVIGRNILLLDDVLTTGRTLTLLADILKSSGANSIYAMVLAKTGATKE